MEHTPPIALESGQAYRFAVRVVHQTGYGPTDPVATVRAECELLVRIENINPSTAPFDPGGRRRAISAYGPVSASAAKVASQCAPM